MSSISFLICRSILARFKIRLLFLTAITGGLLIGSIGGVTCVLSLIKRSASVIKSFVCFDV